MSKFPYCWQKYPWDEWFARKLLVLKKGRDFDCQVHSMAQQVRNAAQQYWVRVSISIQGDTITVSITQEKPRA